MIVLRVIQAAAACLALTALLIAFRPAREPRKEIVIDPAQHQAAEEEGSRLAALLTVRPLDSLESLADAARRPIVRQLDSTTREIRSAGLAMLACLPSLEGPVRQTPAPPRRTN